MTSRRRYVRHRRDDATRRDDKGDEGERGKNKKGGRAHAVEIRPEWVWCMCKQYGLGLVDVAPYRALLLSDGPGSGFRPRTVVRFVSMI